MTDHDIAVVGDLAERLNLAIRRAVRDSGAADKDAIMNGLAAAVALVVSYDSMQNFLDILAACADAKEHARAIVAGEVQDVH